MQRRLQSSRQRFQEIQRELQDRSQGRKDDKNGKASSRSGRSAWQLLGEFWRFLATQRTSVIFALMTVTVSTTLGLVPPAATKFLIDYVLTDAQLPERWLSWWPALADRRVLMWTILGSLLGLACIKSLIHIAGRWAATRATKRLQLRVRQQGFAHAVRLPLNRVHELKSGGVTSLLREDAAAVGELIFTLLYNPWRASIQLLGSLAILAWVDFRLLLGGVAVLPLVYFTHRTWISSIRPQYRAVRNTRQSWDGQTTETFGGMRVVRSFGRQRHEATRFIRGQNLLSRQELRVWWASRGVELLWELLIPLGTVMLLWYGGEQVLSGQLSLGDLMMFLVYLLMLLEPMAILAESAATLQNSLSALDRILDLLQEPAELTATQRDRRKLNRSSVQGQLTLCDVSFSYPGQSRLVLQDISLTIPAGQMVALVGPSGAGKTTLCNLIARFYDPAAGHILLDDHDLRDLDVEGYRQFLGIVEQDVFLFDGTIAENIRFGRSSATDDEVLAAAAVARVDEFVAHLPNGFDTVVGERGVKLSGGQRQRLAIARGLLADPRILILDEATSNLDTENEQLIQRGLTTLLKGRTSIVIAHRLSTIRHADLIVVMRAGRILQTGRHDELMASSPTYRDMVARQAAVSEDQLPESARG
jgi:ATP-binding cassette, subfamily B, bacterial